MCGLRLILVAVVAGASCSHVTAGDRSGREPSADPFASIPRDEWIAESANAFAIRDRNPQAPIHALVISKAAIPTILAAPGPLLGEMLELAKVVAEREGIATSGFRIVINTRPEGGQSVYHVHMHVLGGRQMKWPPG